MMSAHYQGSLGSKLTVFFTATGIVIFCSAPTILTPLWLDAIGNSQKNSSNSTNSSGSDSNPSSYRVDSFSIIFIVNVLYVIICGVLLVLSELFLLKGRPAHQIQRYPKSEFKKFFCIGFADAVASILLVYASSGTRTPPYFLGIAANFAIPVTFIIRFIVIRKRPTCRKFICAVLVIIAEFVALIPQIFSLETKASKAEDGGASGLSGILWPLCFFIGYIPFSTVSVVIEKSAKSKHVAPSGGSSSVPTLHLLFWCYAFCLLVVTCLFWTDLIPVFGSTSGIQEFWEVFKFNVSCFLGIIDCGVKVHIYSALCIFTMLIQRLLTIIFLRITEGANYMAIIMSLQTPVVLIFWTLFDEEPFHWHPHVHLSTILSIVAVCIILPSIYFYNTGSPEVSLREETIKPVDKQTCQDRDDLYIQFVDNSYDSINSTTLQ